MVQALYHLLLYNGVLNDQEFGVRNSHDNCSHASLLLLVAQLTKDYLYYKELETMLEKEYRKFPLHLRVYAYPQAKLVIMAEGLNQEYVYESEDILEEAKQNPTNKEQIVKQLSKLNDTIFTLKDVEFEECNAFIPVKML